MGDDEDEDEEGEEKVEVDEEDPMIGKHPEDLEPFGYY